MERAPILRLYQHPLARVPGGVPAARPQFMEPCHPLAHDETPAGDEWIHELEYEGIRTQSHVTHGQSILYTSDGLDCTSKFDSIAKALRLLAARDAVLDGEVVVLDERGAADKNELHRHIDARRSDRLLYFVFDLLYLDGFDLRLVPLIERKRLLAHLLNILPMRRVRFVEHVEADGPAVLEHACELQIAGIISRKRESAYRAGTQDTWISVKCADADARLRTATSAFAEQRVIAPSKDQLAIYWARVAHRALKHLARRPLELMRYPPGPLPVLPTSVHLLRPKGFLGDTIPPVWIEDFEGLLGLVEIGAIELHPWNCTVDNMDYPNTMVFDLEGIEWRAVTKAALALRDALSADGLKGWPTLTGTNGIQVMASLDGRVTYDLAQRYSAAVAERVMEKDPAHEGQIFIHTGGNYRTRTYIGPYSPRARPGFPIAAPVSWRRIERGVRADAFAITHPFYPS